MHTVWYGWQTLIVDAASIGAGFGIGATGNGGAGAAVYSFGYVFGGPIVHWSHGEVGKGFGSLGLRLGLPLIGGLTGLIVGAEIGAHAEASSSDGQEFLGASFGDAVFGFVIGTGVGGLAAIAIDSAALARHKEYDDDVAASAAPTANGSFTWRPDFALVRSHTTVGGVPGGISAINGGIAGISGTF